MSRGVCVYVCVRVCVCVCVCVCGMGGGGSIITCSRELSFPLLISLLPSFPSPPPSLPHLFPYPQLPFSLHSNATSHQHLCRHTSHSSHPHHSHCALTNTLILLNNSQTLQGHQTTVLCTYVGVMCMCMCVCVRARTCV